MEERFGQAHWPGCNGFISCSYTCSMGMSPSVATLVIPEQPLDSFARVGDLTITDGIGEPITLRNAAVVSASQVQVPTGRALSLQIVDRRRLWKLGEIDGWYNQPDMEPNLEELVLPGDDEFFAIGGPFVPGTARSPLELIRLALAAMGERNATIRAVPEKVAGDGKPVISYDLPGVTTNWLGENPAQALQQILDSLGFLVCYRPNKNDVLITPPAQSVFQFGELPIIADQPGLAAPDPPSSATIIGSPDWIADWLPLRPVGMDGDGKIKPINDLSYKPADGWEPYPPGLCFTAVQRGKCESIRHARELARQWVWRVYRVESPEQALKDAAKLANRPAGWGLGASNLAEPAVDGFPKIEKRRQIMLASAVFTGEKDAIGRQITEPAKVWGSWFAGAGWAKRNAEGEYVDFGFSVDGERGLVTFDRPMWFMRLKDEAAGATNPTFTAYMPDIYLYTSYRVRDQETGQFHAKRWKKEFGGVRTATEIIRRPEMVLTYVVRRRIAAGFVLAARNPIESNESDLKEMAEFFLKASRNKYTSEPKLTRTFAGIYPVDPDGGVRQVTWSVGGGAPATTTVSIATEHANWLPPYPERRRAELLEGIAGRPSNHAGWWRRGDLL